MRNRFQGQFPPGESTWAAVNGKIYAIGGSNPSNLTTNEVYAPPLP
ncbi:MAG: hypothetical protein HYT87_13990 [Nitrospirae bacterium]|nr:hypothetical protein [Nitrospirota bacterium]